jgi:hypothetical protein
VAGDVGTSSLHGEVKFTGGPSEAVSARNNPIKHWPVLRTRAIRHRPYEVLSVVEWCGHLQELILVPDGAEWFSEIPVLGVAK